MAEPAIHVLLVEDDEDLSHLLDRFLGGNGIKVSVAPDGETAWEVLQLDTPHLVLTDLMIPGLSGAEFCAAIRSNPTYARIPIIAMSASLNGDEQAEQMRAILGVELALSKPLHLASLLAHVRRLAAPNAP